MSGGGVFGQGPDLDGSGLPTADAHTARLRSEESQTSELSAGAGHAPELHLVVPGPLEQRTGGYRYDARMVDGLRRRGWRIRIHNLEGRFPAADLRARESMAEALAEIPGGSRVLLDGLAMGGLPAPLRRHRHRLRLVGLVHHPLADETGLAAEERMELAAAERRALGACVGVVATSEYTASRIRRELGVPGERVRVAVPGTDPAPPADGPDPDHPVALLCVGAVTPRKGHDVLVSALAQLDDLPWTCVCAGSLDADPDFARTVTRACRAAGIEGKVRFSGEVDEPTLEALYDSSSLFVLPSHYEGFGMALAEALVRGVPVVSTTGGAIPHTVPSDAGVLVPPGDPEALSRAQRPLLEPKGRPSLEALSTAARRHGVGLPDWDRAAEGLARALLELTPEGAAHG